MDATDFKRRAQKSVNQLGSSGPFAIGHCMRDGQVVNGLSLRVARNCGNPHMGLQIAPK